MLRIESAFLSALFFAVLGMTGQAAASAGFPCVTAASSKNGNFLVVSDTQFESPDSEEVRRFAELAKAKPQNFLLVREVSFRVYSRETFINAKDRMTSGSAFWGGWDRWRVTLDAHNDSDKRFTGFCALPLISDNGAFLILLSTGATGAQDVALRIYRHDRLSRDAPFAGVPVRDIPLREIWPPDHRFDEFRNDSTPQWFADGTFEFSADSTQLFHRTRWGNTVRIDLAAGSVVRETAIDRILP